LNTLPCAAWSPIFLITPQTFLIEAKQFSKYRVEAAWGSHFSMGAGPPTRQKSIEALAAPSPVSTFKQNEGACPQVC